MHMTQEEAEETVERLNDMLQNMEHGELIQINAIPDPDFPPYYGVEIFIKGEDRWLFEDNFIEELERLEIVDKSLKESSN